jgi:D-sedoheptulose 7-phosphate isomerase
MDTLARILEQSNDVIEFSEAYGRYLSGLLSRLDAKAVGRLVEELEQARERQQTVFFIGNGGSAATASHMANDLGVGTRASETGKPLRALALTDNVAAMTAIGNDSGYDNLFLYQLRIHYRPGDKLVAISASGNSPNLLAAAEWVKQRGGTVIGLVGFDGGKLKTLCDVVIHVETEKGEYGPVEDIHMIVDHLVYTWLLNKGLAKAVR